MVGCTSGRGTWHCYKVTRCVWRGTFNYVRSCMCWCPCNIQQAMVASTSSPKSLSWFVASKNPFSWFSTYVVVNNSLRPKILTMRVRFNGKIPHALNLDLIFSIFKYYSRALSTHPTNVSSYLVQDICFLP